MLGRREMELSYLQMAYHGVLARNIWVTNNGGYSEDTGMLTLALCLTLCSFALSRLLLGAPIPMSSTRLARIYNLGSAQRLLIQLGNGKTQLTGDPTNTPLMQGFPGQPCLNA